MELFTSFTQCALLLLYVTRSEALTVTVDGERNRQVKPGTKDVQFLCRVDQGLAFTLTHTAKWVHVSLVDPSNPMYTTLTDSGDVVASKTLYSMLSSYTASSVDFRLTLKTVQDSSDGDYRCQVTVRQGGQVAASKTVTLWVLHEPETLELTPPNGAPMATAGNTLKVNLPEGHYDFLCKARRYNGFLSLNFYWDDNTVLLSGGGFGQDSAASKAAWARMYEANETARNVYLSASHTGRILSCKATFNFTGVDTQSASLLINIGSPTLEPISDNTTGQGNADNESGQGQSDNEIGQGTSNNDTARARSDKQDGDEESGMEEEGNSTTNQDERRANNTQMPVSGNQKSATVTLTVGLGMMIFAGLAVAVAAGGGAGFWYRHRKRTPPPGALPPPPVPDKPVLEGARDRPAPSEDSTASVASEMPKPSSAASEGVQGSEFEASKMSETSSVASASCP